MSDQPQRKPADLVTEKDVEIVLRADKGSSAKLQKFEIKDFTGIGDNYSSHVSSVIVEYEQGKKKSTNSYVVKLNPCRGMGYERSIVVLFQKEIKFFAEVAPLLNKELESIGEARLRIPKYHHSVDSASNEVMYLEDLRKFGFKMSDRRKGMDRQHTNLILKELGRFHASGVILFSKNQLKGISILKHFPMFEDALLKLLCGDSSTLNLNTLFGAALSSVAKMIDGIEGYEYAVEYLHSQKDSCSTLILEMLNTKENMEVLCHGDCWNNNFLFK